MAALTFAELAVIITLRVRAEALALLVERILSKAAEACRRAFRDRGGPTATLLKSRCRCCSLFVRLSFAEWTVLAFAVRAVHACCFGRAKVLAGFVINVACHEE